MMSPEEEIKHMCEVNQWWLDQGPVMQNHIYNTFKELKFKCTGGSCQCKPETKHTRDTPINGGWI